MAAEQIISVHPAIDPIMLHKLSKSNNIENQHINGNNLVTKIFALLKQKQFSVMYPKIYALNSTHSQDTAFNFGVVRNTGL